MTYQNHFCKCIDWAVDCQLIRFFIQHQYFAGVDGMKRKGFFVLAAGVVFLCVIVACVSNSGEKEKKQLSTLDEDECLAFLTDMGVTIPEEFRNHDDLGLRVKEIISDLEADPDRPSAVSYSVAAEFFEDIRGAVKRYYGLDP
jgi:hypothetical protein